MKLSKFNIPFIYNEKFFVYNSFRNSFAEVSKSVWEAISEKVLWNDKDFSKNLISTLTYGGFLVSDDKDEIAVLKVRNRRGRYDQFRLGVTVAPTLKCNFQCQYCFQEISCCKELSQIDFVDKVCDFILDHLGGKKELGICWYGGEPLLEIDTIKKISERILKVTDLLGIDYNADIISNGYLMTPDTAKVLAENCRVDFWQVTLDGPEHVHDKRRVLKSGGKTYSKIFNNLFCSYQHFKRVAVRVNVDKTNTHYVEDFIEELAVAGLAGKIDLYFSPVEEFSENCLPLKDNLLKFKEFSTIESALNSKAVKVGFDIVRKPKVLSNFCGADRLNSFVLDRKGNISKCWNSVGLNKEKIGFLGNKEFNDKYYKWMAYEPFDSSECLQCNILPLCMGGCPYAAINKTYINCMHIKDNLVDKLKELYISQLDVDDKH